VRVALDPSDVHVKIGLTGHAEVRAGEYAEATLIPSSALRRSNTGQEQVVICATAPTPSTSASKDKTLVAEVRAVKLGARQGDRVQVLEGAALGERVVADHALGLEPRAKLIARNVDDAPPGSTDSAQPRPATQATGLPAGPAGPAR
jgi:multidrug efflux pump subunit AcrA (membrane-fusion protein)